MGKPLPTMSYFKPNIGLPNPVAALHFVCGCFGVGEKELQRTLERVRKFAKNPDEHFPSKFHRMLLVRSRAGDKQWDEALCIIQREALYDHIRRENGKPLFSFAGEIADKLVASLTLLYEKLLPKLDVDGVPTTVAIWILVENVFVPTAYAELVKSWRLGLGSEFRGDTCWYLPLRMRDESLKPIPRVLEHWLRVAGFRTAYGVSKEIGTDRSAVDEWRRGEKVPNLRTLHRLVEKFVSEVSWLDEPNGWQARFTLACAMQNLCERMDDYFKDVNRDSSFALTKMFSKIADNHIVSDEGGLLADTHSFFATRLLQRRLQGEKKWEESVLAVSVTRSAA